MGDEDRSLDSVLLQEPSYHGYLPREDLVYVLQQHGDFILRSTEVVSDEKRKKELVMSVLVDPDGKCTNRPMELDVKENMIKNVIVNRVPGGRYAIEPGFRFESPHQLVRHYSANSVRLNNTVVQMLRAVRLMRWEFSHRDVSVGKVLGSGAFGDVHKGTMKKKNGKMISVAIKTLRTNSANVCKEKINEMMREARMMRNLSHPNVVKIYGVALCEQPLYILLELVKGGSLDAYLKQHSELIDRDEKLQMVMGAVWGLTYLHRCGILHRDIASRNCLYDEDKNVKISDFGLSRQGTLYRMKTAMKMPIKWMAPESIDKFIFSQKTDVYSCGVLIWEIFACKQSFDGLSNTESKQRILDSKWNDFPEGTPPTLVRYVQEKMWEKDPAKRATMQHICQWMEKYTGLSRVEPVDEGKDAVSGSGTDQMDDKKGSKVEEAAPRKSQIIAKKEKERSMLVPVDEKEAE